MTNLERQIEAMSFIEQMQKRAQDEGGGGMLGFAEGLAVPTLLGLGGYAVARGLGQEKFTGVPDVLMGPAAGLGIGIPIYRGIKGMIGRRRSANAAEAEYQRALEQEMALQQQLQDQSQQFMQDAMVSQAGGGMPLPGMTVTGSLKEAQISGGGIADTSKTYGRCTSKMPPQKKAQWGGGGAYGRGTSKSGQLGGGETYGPAGARGTSKQPKKAQMEYAGTNYGGNARGTSKTTTKSPLLTAALKKRAQDGSLRIPMDQVDAAFQQAQQQAQQKAQQQAQTQMQQAAIAQLVKAQFRGLGRQQQGRAPGR